MENFYAILIKIMTNVLRKVSFLPFLILFIFTGWFLIAADVQAQPGFVPGGRVQTKKNVYVRSAPGLSSNLLGMQQQPALGTVFEGPIFSNGFNWWNIDYDDGMVGWTIEDYLTNEAIDDTTPPLVSIVSPVDGAAVSGTVPITAFASDANGISGVAYFFDDMNIGTEQFAPPYLIGLDTTVFSNATHTISAMARDTTGNFATSTPIIITVANLSEPPLPPMNESGLMAYYNFDEGAGVTANDSSGQLNNGAISGASWTTGKFGGALLFDGINDIVTVSDSDSLDLNFGGTFEAWVFPTDATDWMAILTKAMPNNIGGLAYGFYANSGAVLDHPLNRPAGFIGSQTAVYSNLQIPANQWAHLAFTYDGAFLNFYVNGVLAGSAIMPGTFLASPEPLIIGGRAGGNQFFAGRLDEIRIYNRALTNAEIQADASFSDAVLPAVSIISPANGASVSGAIALNASVTDNIGISGTQFKIDGANLGAEVLFTPFSTQLNTADFSNGLYALTALTRDVGGNIAASSPVNINIFNPAPAPLAISTAALCSFNFLAASTTDLVFPIPSFLSPANGSVVSGEISLSSRAVDNVKVAGLQFKRDCVNIGPESLSSIFSLSRNTAWLSDGLHLFSAQARDGAGNRKTSQNAAAIIDNTAPLVMKVSAVDVNINSARIVWNTNEPATGQIEYGSTTAYNLVSLEKKQLVKTHSITLVNLSAGRIYHYRVKSKDAAGNLGISEDFTFTTPLGPVPPFTISISAPVDGSFINKTVTINAIAPASVIGTQFQLDGADLGAEDITPPFSINGDTLSFTNGLHLLSAVGRNVSGVLIASPKIAAFFDNSAPVISSVSTAMVSSTAAVITWMTDEPADSQIEYGVLLGPVAMTVLNSSLSIYHAQVLNDLKPDMLYRFRMKSKDAVGNISIGQIFSFKTAPDLAPPTVSIFTPANGSAVAGQISIGAMANDNIGISGVLFKTNDLKIGVEDILSPYSVLWDTNKISGGLYQLTATARDRANNQTISAPASVTVQKSAKFNLGDRVSVAGSVNVRTLPNASSSLLGTKTAGSLGTIIDGPSFGSGFWWWRVNYDINPDGWSIEDQLLKISSETTPPIVKLLIPSPNVFVGSTTVLLATASDNIKVAGVQFKLDGVNLGLEDTMVPYNFIWNTKFVGDGVHTVGASARDFAGNISTVPDRSITVDNTFPFISLVAAFANASGTTSAGAKISWLTNEQASMQIDYGSTITYGSSSPLSLAMATSHIQTIQGLTPNILYHYRVKSKDRAGNLALSGDSTFMTPVDVIPPKISGVTASAITNISASISWATNEISDTQIEYGFTTAYGSLSPLIAAPAVSHNTRLIDLAPGTLYHYRVISKDSSGNLAVSGDFTFTTAASATDLTAPTVSIPTPSGVSPLRGIVTVTAGASDNIRIFGVQFQIDSVNINSEDTIAPYSFIWNTATVTDGSHAITAVARDTSGNTSSVSKNVIVDNTAPVVSSVAAVPVLTTITTAKATVNWLTDEPATTQIEYGLTPTYGSMTPLNAFLTSSHSQTISTIFPETLYHFRVKSKNKAGGETISPDFTFLTP